jgi:transcription factor S
MFCPKCGSILLPRKEGNRKILGCSCGYKTKETDSATITEGKTVKDKEIEVIDRGTLETLPKMDADCPKCGNKKAYFWLVQTRAADEPETKFLKCEKCGHTWRDYD